MSVESEFKEPVIAKKKSVRAVHTPAEVYADLPDEESQGKAKLSDMGELEAREWLMNGKRVGVSYVIPPRLKAAFAKAVLLEGSSSANGAICSFMLDLVIKHKAEIDL